jgi:DNA-binding NtrC family response regulator
MTVAHAFIFEDNASNLKVLGEMLGMMDVTYTALQDPAYVENYFDVITRSDVIFIDLEMPNWDGYQVLQWLKAQNIAAPTVAYTVHTSEMNEARRQGFHSFLGKPLHAERFPDQLTRILNREEVWEAK